MSEAYKQFAKDTYDTAYNNMANALPETGDLPMFVFSGEVHKDLMIDHLLNVIIPDEDENPALAGAYTHMANIQAASDHFGKDNVVVSFELNSKDLQRLISKTKNLRYGEHLTQDDYITPIFEAIKFSVDNGYEIVASDPLHGENVSKQERFDAEIVALKNQANRVENPFKIIVHIGGSDHIGNLQGYKLEEVESNGAKLQRDQDQDPLNGIYGSKLFYNTSQSSPSISILSLHSDFAYYLQNPANAMQIDPPGAMDERDKLDIAKRIQDASAEMHYNPDIAPPIIITDGYKSVPAIKP